MYVFLRIDINLIAIVLLSIVLFIANRRLNKQDSINKTFLTVSRIIGFQICFETITCIINKRPELWLIPISVAFHICLYVTGPILTYYWLVFVRSMIAKGRSMKSKWDILLVIPTGINALLTLLTPLYPLVFDVSANNVYQRGPLFFVSAVFVYFYLLLGFVLVIKNRRKLVRQGFLPLMTPASAEMSSLSFSTARTALRICWSIRSGVLKPPWWPTIRPQTNPMRFSAASAQIFSTPKRAAWSSLCTASTQ